MVTGLRCLECEAWGQGSVVQQGVGGQPWRRRKGQYTPTITLIVFCSKPFGILEPMKDVRVECDVIVVMFWKDYLNSNRESWLKGS